MTPVDRQNRERFLRVTSGHAARIYEFRVGFELERPANPRGGRSKWNSTGRSAPLPVSSFYPSPVPFYPSPYPGEPPRRPLNVNDRSPNDEVPPMHNATPFLPSSAIETSTPAIRQEPLTKRVRSYFLDLFICLPFESSRFLCIQPCVLEISLSFGSSSLGEDVIGEVGSFQRIIKNFEKYLCRSCFDEKRAIIPRIYSLSRPRVYTPFSCSTIKFRIFLFKFSLSRNIDI